MKAMIATAEARNGYTEHLETLITELAGNVRKEAGNLRFEVFRDQSNPAIFRMLEIYKDEQAFQAHLNSDYVSCFNEALKTTVTGGASDVVSIKPFANNEFSCPGVRGVDHVGLTVPKMDAAAQFFEQAFGAVTVYDLVTEKDDPMAGEDAERQLGIPDGAKIVRMKLMRIGDSATLELFQFADTPQHDAISLNDFGLTHVALYVDDIKKAAQKFEEAGGKLLSDVHPLAGVEDSENNAGVYGRAPWGSLIELVTYPDGIDYNADAIVTRWTPSLLQSAKNEIIKKYGEKTGSANDNNVIKMTMLLKRHPDISHEEFVKHHIEKHGPLFQQIPDVNDHVLRYIQTHPVNMTTDVVPVDEAYDGTAELWFKSQSSLEAIMTSDFYQNEVFPDEKTFLDHENTLITIGDQINIIG